MASCYNSGDVAWGVGYAPAQGPLASPGVTVKDCRSLYDCMKSERVLLSDRRLSLEAAIIRQSLQEGIECRWVPSEQQLADALTKALHQKGLAYLNDVLYSNKWTLGPSPRLPETSRSRKLEIPDVKPKPERSKITKKPHLSTGYRSSWRRKMAMRKVPTLPPRRPQHPRTQV